MNRFQASLKIHPLGNRSILREGIELRRISIFPEDSPTWEKHWAAQYATDVVFQSSLKIGLLWNFARANGSISAGNVSSFPEDSPALEL